MLLQIQILLDHVFHNTNKINNQSKFYKLPERNQQPMPKQLELPLAPFVFHSAVYICDIKKTNNFCSYMSLSIKKSLKMGGFIDSSVDIPVEVQAIC